MWMDGLRPIISNLLKQVTVLEISNHVGGGIRPTISNLFIQVTVLKSSNRVGGRIKTYHK